MRLMTWNINGLRSLKTPIKELLDSFNCEIICFQETKVTKDMLEEHLAIVDGYTSYFSYSKVKSGYSGVATYVKNECTPWVVEDGLSNVGKKGVPCIGCYGNMGGLAVDELTKLDSEGRCIMTEHQIMTTEGKVRMLVVVNVYCPRADVDDKERMTFKLNFYKLLQARTEEIFKSGRSVIIVGDINTSHRAIDHCEPGDARKFQSDPGRLWMDSFICTLPESKESLEKQNEDLVDTVEDRRCFVDVLRLFHPKTPHLFTNWCSSTGARSTNYGTRLDYILADKKLELEDEIFLDCHVRQDIMGSDHCPVVVELSCTVLPSPSCSTLCTKYLFLGKQTKLAQFVNSTIKKLELEDNSDKDQSIPPELKPVPGKRSCPFIDSTCKQLKKKDQQSQSNSILQYFSGNSKSKERDKSPHWEGRGQSSAESSSSHLSSGSSQEEKPVVFEQKNLWKNILTGPPKAPSCTGHKELCVMRSVKKPGPNRGRSFWVCSRPEGHKSNKEARCDFFMWVSKQ